MTQSIKSFYDLEESVKQSVQSHIDDNQEDIKEARKEYGEIDQFFYEDEMREASRDIADNYAMYYYDAYNICNVTRFGTFEEMEYFNDAEQEVQDCHNGENYIDKYMTSIAYLIVERLAMEFFSQLLILDEQPLNS